MDERPNGRPRRWTLSNRLGYAQAAAVIALCLFASVVPLTAVQRLRAALALLAVDADLDLRDLRIRSAGRIAARRPPLRPGGPPPGASRRVGDAHAVLGAVYRRRLDHVAVRGSGKTGDLTASQRSSHDWLRGAMPTRRRAYAANGWLARALPAERHAVRVDYWSRRESALVCVRMIGNASAGSSLVRASDATSLGCHCILCVDR
jgi:hypothetical protein